MKGNALLFGVGLWLLTACRGGEEGALAGSPASDPAGPCSGRVTDKDPRPMRKDLRKPAPGESYVDPAFGTTITRITAADPAEGEGAVIKPLYPTVRAWNADGSLLLLWHRGGGYELYQGGRPYRHLRTITFNGPTEGNPEDIEQIFWDPLDPLTFYYPSNYRLSNGPAPRLYQRRLVMPNGPDVTTIVRRFEEPPTNCPIAEGLRTGSHPHDMALGPRKIIGLVCGPSSNATHLLYSISEDQVLATVTRARNDGPWPLPSETGAYFPDTGAVTNLSLQTVRTIVLKNYVEHAALAGLSGRDTYNLVSFDDPKSLQGTLVSYRLDTGEGRVIVGPSTGWPYPKSTTHISQGASDGSGWVAVGMVGEATGQALLDNEILLANVMTGEACRVAHARTMGREGDWYYWAETHVQISPEGRRILFGSDWLGSDTVDTYLIDLSQAGRGF